MNIGIVTVSYLSVIIFTIHNTYIYLSNVNFVLKFGKHNYNHLAA